MGKRLIIKGADFSKNGIPYSLEWYSNNAIDNTSDSVLVYGNSQSEILKWNDYIFPGYILHEQFRGKPVNIIRTRINSTIRNKDYITKLKYHIFYIEATAINTEYKVLKNLMSFQLTADDIKKDVIEIRLPYTVTLSSDNLSGISIGVSLTDLPTQNAISDFSKKNLVIPGIRLSGDDLYYVDSNRILKHLPGSSISTDYGYEQ